MIVCIVVLNAAFATGIIVTRWGSRDPRNWRYYIGPVVIGSLAGLTLYILP